MPEPTNSPPPAVADHTLLRRIGVGSYGEVWLARNVLGTLRAVKLVFRHAFDSERPYEREFSGILKFEPVSRTHPGFVDILQVGRNDPAGYFYYVMELADDATEIPVARAEAPSIEVLTPPIAPASEPTAPTAPNSPDLASYIPKTLKTELRHKGRLSTNECVELAIALTNALDHLHQRGLVHRDIKPANVIFVEGRPQLADIGLVTNSDGSRTHLGTEGYLPPEGAGSPQSDLYSLGKVLYELSTGLDRKEFPELPADLDAWPDRKRFLQLNEIISRACAANPSDRYSSAAKMLQDLECLMPGARRAPWWQGTRGLAAIFAVLALAAAIFFAALNQPATGPVDYSGVTKAERAAGFVPLFNGLNLDEWRLDRMGLSNINWIAADGLLRRIDNGKTNRSRLLHRGIGGGGVAAQDFEFRFDWRIAPGGEAIVACLHGWLSYLVADDTGRPNLTPDQRAGAIADVTGPTESLARPAGQWNEARIVRNGPVVEHWLNDKLAARVNLRESTEMRERLQAAELKNHNARYPEPSTRPWSLRLGERGSPVDFRRLRVRAMSAASPQVSAITEAQTAHKKGASLVGRESSRDILAAVAQFERATAIDPGSGAAFASLAESCNLATAVRGKAPADLRVKARAAAESALRLDPKSALAHAELGGVLIEQDWNWTGGEAALRQALDLDPQCAPAHLYMGMLRSVFGRHREALEHTDRAMARPTNPHAYGRVAAAIRWQAGDAEGARAEFRRLFEEEPASPLNAWQLLAFLEAGAREQEFWAITERHSAALDRPTTHLDASRKAFTEGGTSAFRRLQIQRVGGAMSTFSRAYHEMRAGNSVQAIDWLNKAVEERWREMLFLRVSPLWDGLRADPRFVELVTKAGLPDPAAAR